MRIAAGNLLAATAAIAKCKISFAARKTKCAQQIMASNIKQIIFARSKYYGTGAWGPWPQVS